ncbi:stAR-related lipid transfer protein 13-like, partial [Psammomys obesus]|uniref:stAR-related lipid transfer protein 13-like n=1 Tax=Psammomys obesus TaxID=48139 RepID=UPI002452DFC1
MASFPRSPYRTSRILARQQLLTRIQQEIEVKEACAWLRAAGFPQYAQLYEDSLFPINIAAVKKDHDFLERDLVEPLFRRLHALNHWASMRLDVSVQRRKGDDSDEEDLCLSNKWTFQRTSRRWSRVDDPHAPLPGAGGNGSPGAPEMRDTAISEGVLADRRSDTLSTRGARGRLEGQGHASGQAIITPVSQQQEPESFKAMSPQRELESFKAMSPQPESFKAMSPQPESFKAMSQQESFKAMMQQQESFKAMSLESFKAMSQQREPESFKAMMQQPESFKAMSPQQEQESFKAMSPEQDSFKAIVQQQEPESFKAITQQQEPESFKAMSLQPESFKAMSPQPESFKAMSQESFKAMSPQPESFKVMSQQQEPESFKAMTPQPESFKAMSPQPESFKAMSQESFKAMIQELESFKAMSPQKEPFKATPPPQVPNGHAQAPPRGRGRPGATSKRGGVYLEDLDVLAGTPGGRRGFRSQEDLLFLVPEDHTPGTFPKALSVESLSPAGGDGAGWRTTGHGEDSPPRAPRAGSRVSVYDNVPGSHLYASTGDLLDLERDGLLPGLGPILPPGTPPPGPSPPSPSPPDRQRASSPTGPGG